MKKIKLSLLSLSIFTSITLSACSSFGIDTYNKKDQGNNNSSDIVTPDVDFDDNKKVTPQSALNKTINNLLNSNEIDLSSLNVDVTLNNGKSLKASLSDTIIDLSKTSSLDINIRSNLNLFYDNATLNDVFFTIENDNSLYLKYKTYAYSLEAPKTLNNIISLIQVFSKSASTSNDNQDSIEISTIVNKIKEILKNTEVSETVLSSTTTGYQITFTLPETNINDEVKILSSKFILTTDSNYLLTDISVESLTIEDIKTSKKTTVKLSGSTNVKQTSSYQYIDKSQYTDLTNSSSSLFEALTKLGNDKKANIGLDISLKDTDGNSQSLTGQFKAFASDTFINYDKGDYTLSLEHKKGDKVLNDLNIHYQDETLYLALNNLFRGKVENSTLSEIFDYVSQVGSSNLEKNIADILNKTISQTDFDSLIKGDYSKYEGMIKSFTYTYNQGFKIEFFSKFFGLSTSSTDSFSISLDVIESEEEKGLKNIKIEGLNVSSMTSDVTLSIEDSSNISKTEVTDEEKNYKNYECVTPIFKTLVDLVDDKKMQANIALIYQDTSASINYSLNGKIKADMTNIVKDSYDMNTLSGSVDHYSSGNYEIELNVNTGSNTLNSQFDVRYEDKNIYLGYNYSDGTYMFRNQFPDSEISKIKDVIDSKTKTSTTSTTSASNSLEESNSIISAIKNSENFKNLKENIKNGSLKDLDNFIYIDKTNQDTSKIVIQADADYFLKDTSYEGKVSDITFSINTETNKISSLDLNLNNSLADSKEDKLSLSISFEDYVEDLLSDTDKKTYTVINNASQLVGVFYSLPTTLQKFGLEVDASVKYKADNGNDQEVKLGEYYETYGDTSSTKNKGFAAVDLSDTNNPICYGGIGITHPFLGDNSKTADQKVVFNYSGVFDKTTLKLTDGHFEAKYNDNMNISMEKSDVQDIMKTAKSIDENNLLYRYLGDLQNGTSGLPIMDIISTKNPAILLQYKYIKSVDITDNKITIVASSKLFDDTVTSDNDQDETLVIEHDGTNITKATISAVVGKYTVSASLVLTSFDKYSKPNFDTSDGYTVDMSGFKTLLTCLVNTTKHNYMELEGSFKLNMKVLSFSSSLIDIDASAKAKIYIENNEAYAYIAVNNHSKNMSDDGYRMTEFFIKEQQVFVCQTKTSTSISWFKTKYTTTSEYFYTTAEDFTKPSHLVYYLFNYVLDSGNILNNALTQNIKDDDSSSSSNLISSNDFSKVINKAELDSTNRTFTLSLNLGSIFSIPSITFDGSQELVLGYSLDSDPYLNSLSIGLKVNVAGGIATGELKSSECKFSLSLPDYGSTCPYSENGKMSRYYKFVTACGGFENPNLKTSLITKVNEGVYLIKDTSAEYDNPKTSGGSYSNTGSYGSGPTSVYFYHDN